MSCNSCNCRDDVENEGYEEFVPRKGYLVGDFFKIGREVFKVVEHEDCTNCDFDNINNCTRSDICDANSVSFILFDTLDEDET